VKCSLQTRATIELLQEETQEFIPPQLWTPNLPDVSPVITTCGEYCKRRWTKNKNRWICITDLNELQQWLRTDWAKLDHASLQQSFISAGAEKLKGTKVWVITPGRKRPALGQRPGWVLGAGGVAPPAVRVKFLKTQMLNPAFWWLLCLLVGSLGREISCFFENYGQEVRGNNGPFNLKVGGPVSPGPYGCWAYASMASLIAPDQWCVFCTPFTIFPMLLSTEFKSGEFEKHSWGKINSWVFLYNKSVVRNKHFKFHKVVYQVKCTTFI